MLRWRKKKSTLFIARKKIFYEAIAKWGPSAAFWSVWRKTAWLTASKLDHKFSGWWQHVSAHPKGKDLNKLHFNILGSFIPGEITQKQRNTHTWKSNRPKGLAALLCMERVTVRLKWSSLLQQQVIPSVLHMSLLWWSTTLWWTTPIFHKNGFES